MENYVPEPAAGWQLQVIGLTGGIGSGKSTVANIIEEKGYPVYYSDSAAKDIVNTEVQLRQRIVELLGSEAYTDNLYNRKYVAEKVFSDAELLTALNGLIHPAVRLDFENWVPRQTTPFVFKETALLFELGLEKDCFKSVLVTADDNIRIKRVMDRDNKTYREVETIMERQMPEKDKIKRADFVIYNNGTLDELYTETAALLMTAFV